ncbi:glycoside hydrolase family protein [Pelagicoccus mobilis]|uniref:Glycoside hydrolase family protein n=1 Tax=Pelagicoccus mobilis TaxID=415221 RepID=A0A934RVM0_9BACT|nr:glycoside hydrolase family protein [Pelagicoccus mobilis]MBK1877637.1 glycoside hydrolase family protein [Pelagicoccus mobilis]
MKKTPYSESSIRGTANRGPVDSFRTLLLLSIWAVAAVFASAEKVPERAKPQVREKPAEWANLVPGGQFKDLILPMPIRGGLTSDTWGSEGVKPRDVTNGIEDPAWSYWCGYPYEDENGKFHLYTARWPEDHPDGHFGYFDSEIVHAVADDPMGPYVAMEVLGEGHNPELITPTKISKQGRYLVYSTHGRYFAAESLSGPWKRRTYDFHKRERYVFKGYVNFSFAPRDDGSYIAVSRRGYIWASPDGAENWYNTSAESVYPKVPGTFEDPVMWKDDIQYHIVVNDWRGRIAYYLRSLDGFHWNTEPGEAYVPGIAVYEDGTKPDWYKYERIRFLQDEHGRPTHVYFAVIDSDKYNDNANDEHNSKLISLPMTVARLAVIENSGAVTAKTKRIRVRIKAEEGFNPHSDLDIESLRFGSSDEVNYGRGSKVVDTERDGKDLILSFSGKQSGLTMDNWAGKLLGKNREGGIAFAWARLPETEEKVPLLSALSPRFEFTADGLEAYVEVQNFGEIASERSKVSVQLKDGELIAKGAVRPLEPFETAIVRLSCRASLPKGKKLETTVVLESSGRPTEIFTKEVVLPRN